MYGLRRLDALCGSLMFVRVSNLRVNAEAPE